LQHKNETKTTTNSKVSKHGNNSLQINKLKLLPRPLDAFSELHKRENNLRPG